MYNYFMYVNGGKENAWSMGGCKYKLESFNTTVNTVYITSMRATFSLIRLNVRLIFIDME